MLAVILGLLVIYLAIRVVGPAALRILRPVLFLLFALAALLALYPSAMCSLEFLSKLPIFCAH
ncbi:MAG TPA: hypothetical protein VE963_18875 [Reyranella sp.]|nr:hypothetical protein [Reyranella sp.]